MTCPRSQRQDLPAQSRFQLAQQQTFEDDMNDLAEAAKKIAAFIQTLTTIGGMRLRYKITAGAGAADPYGLERREIYVELSGPDAPLLTERYGEVLRALEHIAAKILRLEPEDHDRISFDADGFKATRNRELDLMAEMAIQKVRATGEPFSFSPMSSRERRILHLALAKSGLPTASSGIGPGRFVVLYPEGSEPVSSATPSAEDRTRAIRNSFRRR